MNRLKFNPDFIPSDFKPKFRLMARVFIFIIIVALLYFSIPAEATSPGTPSDPLVSRSYVDALVAQIWDAIHEIQATGLPYASAATGATQAQFTVVRALEGDIIIGRASTEFILRAGLATVVSGENGLVNVTLGHDITNGQIAYGNHLLIVPTDDGRGLQFHTNGWLMVKGDFYFAGRY